MIQFISQVLQLNYKLGCVWAQVKCLGYIIYCTKCAFSKLKRKTQSADTNTKTVRIHTRTQNNAICKLDAITQLEIQYQLEILLYCWFPRYNRGKMQRFVISSFSLSSCTQNKNCFFSLSVYFCFSSISVHLWKSVYDFCSSQLINERCVVDFIAHIIANIWLANTNE